MPKVDWIKEINKSENENIKRDNRLCDIYNPKRNKDNSDQKKSQKNTINT